MPWSQGLVNVSRMHREWRDLGYLRSLENRDLSEKKRKEPGYRWILACQGTILEGYIGWFLSVYRRGCRPNPQ